MSWRIVKFIHELLRARGDSIFQTTIMIIDFIYRVYALPWNSFYKNSCHSLLSQSHLDWLALHCFFYIKPFHSNTRMKNATNCRACYLKEHSRGWGKAKNFCFGYCTKSWNSFVWFNLFLIWCSSVQYHRYCCPCSTLFLNVFDFILLVYFFLPAKIAAN